MFVFMSLLLNACSINSGPIYFESGTYVLDPSYFEEPTWEDTGFEDTVEESSTMESEYAAEMETFALVVDLENLTAKITGTSFDTTLTLKELPKKDWYYTCPMQLSSTDVQTVDIVEGFDLWGESHSETFLYAYDCHGEPRTTNDIVLADRSYSSTILSLTKQ